LKLESESVGELAEYSVVSMAWTTASNPVDHWVASLDEIPAVLKVVMLGEWKDIWMEKRKVDGSDRLKVE
jgi:hypothetical protein